MRLISRPKLLFKVVALVWLLIGIGEVLCSLYLVNCGIIVLLVAWFVLRLGFACYLLVKALIAVYCCPLPLDYLYYCVLIGLGG